MDCFASWHLTQQTRMYTFCWAAYSNAFTYAEQYGFVLDPISPTKKMQPASDSMTFVPDMMSTVQQPVLTMCDQLVPCDPTGFDINTVMATDMWMQVNQTERSADATYTCMPLKMEMMVTMMYDATTMACTEMTPEPIMYYVQEDRQKYGAPVLTTMDANMMPKRATDAMCHMMPHFTNMQAVMDQEPFMNMDMPTMMPTDPMPAPMTYGMGWNATTCTETTMMYTIMAYQLESTQYRYNACPMTPTMPNQGMLRNWLAACWAGSL